MEALRPFLCGRDEMVGEHLLGRTLGVEGGTHAFVALPQRRMDHAQGES
ncbi:hypothetical protein ACFTXM_02725 [Streptomyces sp. NPDC056930]